MGHRTSVYLTDDLAEAVAASGLTLAEHVRRSAGMSPGLSLPAQEDVRRIVREEMPGIIADEVRAVVRDEVRSALREVSGGGY